ILSRLNHSPLNGLLSSLNFFIFDLNNQLVMDKVYYPGIVRHKIFHKVLNRLLDDISTGSLDRSIPAFPLDSIKIESGIISFPSGKGFRPMGKDRLHSQILKSIFDLR